MKKLMFATVFATAAAAFATEYNKIGFEGYNSGDFLPPYTLVNGVAEQEEAGGNKTDNYFCYAGEADGSTVKAYGGNDGLTAPNITRPLAFQGATPNLNYLELSTEGGVLWRSINAVEEGEGSTFDLGTAQTIGSDGIYLDTLVQFTPTEDGGAPELDDEDKLAIWLNVDSSDSTPVTNLMVRAGSYDDEGALSVDGASFVLSGKTVVAGEWYRLTVKAIDNVLPDNEYYKIPGFQVFIDGTEMSAATSPLSVTWLETLQEGEVLSASQVTELSSGKFLPSLIAGENGVTSTLQGVGFKGSGALDDIVWTTEDPFAGGSSGDDAWIATVTQIFDGANLDSAEKAKITAWASANNIVVDTAVQGQAEIAAAAYLLNLATLPGAVPELTITSIEEGESAWTLTVAASANDTAVALPATLNGAVMLKQAATLAGLASANAAVVSTFTIANGTATVTVAKDAAAAKFMKVGVGIAPAQQ